MPYGYGAVNEALRDTSRSINEMAKDETDRMVRMGELELRQAETSIVRKREDNQFAKEMALLDKENKDKELGTVGSFLDRAPKEMQEKFRPIIEKHPDLANMVTSYGALTSTISQMQKTASDRIHAEEQQKKEWGHEAEVATAKGKTDLALEDRKAAREEAKASAEANKEFRKEVMKIAGTLSGSEGNGKEIKENYRDVLAAMNTRQTPENFKNWSIETKVDYHKVITSTMDEAEQDAYFDSLSVEELKAIKAKPAAEKKDAAPAAAPAGKPKPKPNEKTPAGKRTGKMGGESGVLLDVPGATKGLRKSLKDIQKFRSNSQ